MEGEALLLGKWKNIEDLEECLTMAELELVVKASREKEHRMMRFYAAFKGVDLDKESKVDAQERLNEVKRRANARLRGESVEDVKTESGPSFADFGLEVEVLD